MVRAGIQIDIPGLDALIKDVADMPKRATRARRRLTDRMRRRIRSRILKEIIRLPGHNDQSFLGKKHNTPQSLTKTLHSKQTSTGQIAVWMQRRGRGVKPEWVEFGTKPHANRRMPDGQHPGATAKFPFRKGVNKFEQEDLTKLSIEALNGIVSETEGSKFAATKTFGRID